ncbi:MAG: alkaline phosphatase family protein [Mycolicibacterium sp.]|nr:alkaline phosphatase family protein [Mycolicibacterium sp.]
MSKPSAATRSATTRSATTTALPAASASRRSSVGAPPSVASVAVPASVSATTGSRSRVANAIASQVGDPPPNHVLLIGTDGTNLDKVLQYAYDQPDSGFRAVMEQGVTGATSIVGHTTISGPSWTTILTGVWDNKSGVINNIFNPVPYDAWPTVFNLIEYSRPEVATAVYADWKYINDMADAGGYPADVNEFVAFDTTWEDTDDTVVDATIARIAATAATDSSFIFSYQVAVDEAGHAAGGGSPEYAAAVVNTSENIKRIMDAIDAWETLNPDEEWTVIVTTDHGHQQSVGFGHGFQSPNETSSFVIFDLAGDDANDGRQNLDYSTADITPTIVSLFDVPLRSDFDGVPMQSNAAVLDSLVTPDNLKQALNDAVAMYGYPNIGTDIALGVRTVVASVPYFLDIITNTITAQLQAIVDQQIFLISTLAQGAQFVVQLTGDALVAVTQAVARAVGHLTGAGTIPPTDAPLPAPSADSVRLPMLPAAALV